MRDAIWRKCCGEAHSNPYIDNCWTCAPFWELFPACPDCAGTLTRVASKQARQVARCTNSACASVRRWFNIANEPTKSGSLVWFGTTFVEIGLHMLGMCDE
jgi:hypothetical protein